MTKSQEGWGGRGDGAAKKEEGGQRGGKDLGAAEKKRDVAHHVGNEGTAGGKAIPYKKRGQAK